MFQQKLVNILNGYFFTLVLFSMIIRHLRELSSDKRTVTNVSTSYTRKTQLVFSMWVCNVFPKSTMKHYPFKTVANSLKVVSVCSCPGWWAGRQPAGQPDGSQPGSQMGCSAQLGAWWPPGWPPSSKMLKRNFLIFSHRMHATPNDDEKGNINCEVLGSYIWNLPSLFSYHRTGVTITRSGLKAALQY